MKSTESKVCTLWFLGILDINWFVVLVCLLFVFAGQVVDRCEHNYQGCDYRYFILYNTTSGMDPQPLEIHIEYRGTYLQQGCLVLCQTSLRTHKSSLEGATELKFASFCSS